MDITITLKAEPKLLKAIDALVECLQAQGTLATTLTTFEPQTGTTVEPLPEIVPEIQHPINVMAERIGNITRILHPQATGASIHDLGPVDDYLNSVVHGFLQARGLVKITDLSAAEDLDALLYTLQGAAAQRTAAQQAIAAPTFPAPAAPIYPQQPVYQQPVYQAPVAPSIQVYQAPVQQMPAPVIVPTTAPVYTLNQLSVAGAMLAESGKREEIRALLGKYNVPALTQLPKEHYGNFATDLRALGGKI